jgi:hypothetical protein
MGQRKMNGATATVYEPGNVLPMRGVPDDPTVRPPTWMERRAIELGVIEMAAAPTKPPGFYVNFTTISFLIVVLSAIGGLWWFTWQTAYQRGERDAQIQAEREQSARERKALEERIVKAEEDARKAKEFGIATLGDKKTK